MTKLRAFRRLLPILLIAVWMWLPQVVLAAPTRQSVPVHALAGMLRPAEDQVFRTNLVTGDGSVYALLGFTPEIETQIQTLLAQGPELVVKVWGDLYPQGRGYSGPEIIVSDIQPAGTLQPPPAATATPTAQSSGAIVIARIESVNLYGGPGQEHAVVGQMVQGESCLIVGRNEINSWLHVRCSSGIEGWVTSTVVDLEGDLSRIAIIVVVTPVPPTPTATATPTAPSSGAVVIARIESVDLHAGPDQKHIVVGQIVQGESCLIVGRNEIDSWLQVRCSSGVEGWVTRTVVDLEGDLSRIAIVVVAPPPLFSGWRASYFANRNLEGEPVLVQEAPAVDFDWGLGSPAPVVPVDNFSARFERVLNFIPDTYRLCICNLDDGARLFIDDQLVLNGWQEGAARDLIVERPLSGEHRILIEYFEAGNAASIRFVYADSTGSLGDWQAVYWNDGTLVGTRPEPRGASGYALDYNWGIGSPIPGVVHPDNFSARWEAPFDFEAGNYLFNINSDDGVRVSMDGVVVVDAWQGGYNQLSTLVYGVSRGRHQIRVDYYENVGDAIVRVGWKLDTGVREE